MPRRWDRLSVVLRLVVLPYAVVVPYATCDVAASSVVHETATVVAPVARAETPLMTGRPRVRRGRGRSGRREQPDDQAERAEEREDGCTRRSASAPCARGGEVLTCHDDSIRRGARGRLTSDRVLLPLKPRQQCATHLGSITVVTDLGPRGRAVARSGRDVSYGWA